METGTTSTVARAADMVVLGITGGVGAGKSQVLSVLREEYGALVIQTDQVARQLEEPGGRGLELLVKRFGSGILNRDGRLDRAAFAELIFQDKAALQAADDIIHPLTWRAVEERIAQSGEKLVAVESALFDEESRKLCDKLIFVDVSDENRIIRLMADRGYSRQRCLAVMESQPDRESFLALADAVIDNNGSLDETRRQLAGLLAEYTGEKYDKEKRIEL